MAKQSVAFLKAGQTFSVGHLKLKVAEDVNRERWTDDNGTKRVWVKATKLDTNQGTNIPFKLTDNVEVH